MATTTDRVTREEIVPGPMDLVIIMVMMVMLVLAIMVVTAIMETITAMVV